MKQLLTLLLIIGFNFFSHSQTADFLYESSNGYFCSPSEIKFTQNTTGNPIGYIWSFGNNSFSNIRNPKCTYNAPGSYFVKLIVIYKKSTLQVTKTVVINPPVVANFTSDRSGLCAPGVINFRSTITSPISSYEWDFGDESGIHTTTSPAISHHFTGYLAYPISLKATAATGCFGKSFTEISVTKPAISGLVSPVSGCIPATVNFRAFVNLPPASTVTAYTWNYGDGSAEVTSSGAYSTHTYNRAGSFRPSLRIITNDGCSNLYQYRNLDFGTPPVNHIAYAKKNIVCGSESPVFVSKAENANKYLWEFGDGDSTYVTDTLVRHKFRTLGTKAIKVTPYYNDCAGTPIHLSIEVIGVISGFNYTNTCSDKKTFSFNNISQGNLYEITWNFGDGSPVEHGRNVIHNYPDTGSYVTILNVKDNITSCTDLYSVRVYTANPELANPDISICKNSNTSFSIPHNYNNPGAVYEWSVLGMEHAITHVAPFTIKPNTHGYFNDNFVIIKNGQQYCPDTIRLNSQIIVKGPLLAFTGPASLCLGSTYSITNLSKPFITTDLINNWNWEYGIVDHHDNNFIPEPYVFPYWGNFPVKLVATDINGCVDSLVKNVVMYDLPFLVNIPDADTLCAGNTATLIAFHNDPITWTPAAGISCATCDTIVVRPAVTTTYYVKATNIYNCSKTDSVEIFVHKAFKASAEKTTFDICLNNRVQLEVLPANTKIAWSPSTGLSDSTSHNPFASPVQSTIYKALLTDTAGCFSDSMKIQVLVKPLPVADAGPNRTYPYYTGFSLSPSYSNNIQDYLWSPSHLLDCNTCPNPNGIASSTQTYTLTVTANNGCVASDKVTIFVECNGANLLLPTAFSPNNDNLNDYFYPITRGIKKILRFSIYNRQGQKVFEASDFEPNQKLWGWDGKFKGADQNTSAYIYDIECLCDLGETINKKGSFVLLR